MSLLPSGNNQEFPLANLHAPEVATLRPGDTLRILSLGAPEVSHEVLIELTERPQEDLAFTGILTTRIHMPKPGDDIYTTQKTVTQTSRRPLVVQPPVSGDFVRHPIILTDPMSGRIDNIFYFQTGGVALSIIRRPDNL